MDLQKCLQCGQNTNETFNRIVRDSCGHYKCRMCLLKEDTQCVTCNEQPAVVENNTRNVICVNSSVERHTTAPSGNKPFNIKNQQENDNGVLAVQAKNVQNTSVIVNKSKVTCKTASKETKTKKASSKKISKTLPLHIVLKSNENEGKSYLCTVCDRKFQARSQILYHSYCNSTKPFACSLCPKKFVKKSQLQYHTDVHSGNKTVVCDVCNASFYVRSKLIRHMKMHSGVKTHECNLCDSKFNNSRALNIHSLIHSGIKPHVCKTCGSSFRDSSNLRKHEIYSHSDVKFTCLECGKHYKRKCFLVAHSKTHTKSRPWSCTVCLKTFYTKNDRNRHKLIHSETKQFQCQICNTTFKRKDNLERHIRNTHPDTDLSAPQNLSVIKGPTVLISQSVSIDKFIKNIKKIKKKSNKNSKTIECNTSVLNDSACIKSSSDKINTTGDQPLDDDYYKNISEFRNYKNYIPKEFHSFSPNDGGQTMDEISSELLPLHSPVPHLNDVNETESTAQNNCALTLHKEADIPTRLEIIEANNRRQSVIFNTSPNCLPRQHEHNIVQPVHGSTQITEEDNSRSNQSSLSFTDFANTNDLTDDIQEDIFNNIALENTAIKENNYSANDPASIKTLQNKNSKAAKKTINVSEVYRQMFPKGSLATFSNQQTASTPWKGNVEPDSITSPDKSNDCVNATETQQERTPRNLTYIHKKVHYDLNRYSSKNRINYAPQDKPINMAREHNSPCEPTNLNENLVKSYNNCSEKKDSKNYFSPESLELYKKILIPSYKGNSETNISSASVFVETDSGTSQCVDVNSDQNEVSEDCLPPLAPISESICPSTRNMYNFSSAFDHHPLPQLVPLEKQCDSLNSEYCANKCVSEGQSANNPPSHTTDIHWRRRLAHCSNQDI